MFIGKNFLNKANVFSQDRLDLEKRQEMIQASRQLVREVTKLLILGQSALFILYFNHESSEIIYFLADYVDVANLLELSKDVEKEFTNTRRCEDIASFEKNVKELGAKTGKLYIKSGQREEDLLPEHR